MAPDRPDLLNVEALDAIDRMLDAGRTLTADTLAALVATARAYHEPATTDLTAQVDQILAGLGTAAVVCAKHYEQLRGAGIPDALAATLVADLHHEAFVIGHPAVES